MIADKPKFESSRSCSRRVGAILAVLIASATIVTAGSQWYFGAVVETDTSHRTRVPQGLRASETAAVSDELTRLRASEAYGNIPLSFEVNRGQTDPRVQFLSRGAGYTLFLTSTEAVFALSGRNHKTPGRGDAPMKRATADVLRMHLVGSNPAAKVAGLDRLPGNSNYRIGNDPKKWQVHVPTYARVYYQDIYKGVDLVYYGNQRQLENDFIVAAGADPTVITLAFDGTKKITIHNDGTLLLQTADGQAQFHKPLAYQLVNDVRREVASNYVLKNRQEVSFEVAEYDHTRPLVIDPVLVYSTFLGGSLVDEGHGIATDSAGNAYVTGSTESLNFPTANPVQGTYGGNTDAFVAKLNASGTALVYSTYVGDEFFQSGAAIAVDASGNAYVTGEIRIGSGAVDAANVLIMKLDPTGAWTYLTYFGGSASDVGGAIAVDSTGNAYVTGRTSSTDFPTTASGFQTANLGGEHVFIAKLNPEGTSLLYSTLLGGSGSDRGSAIAADAAGNVYVTGTTDSNDFPTSQNAFQRTHNTGGVPALDAFVAKLNTNASGTASLVYSTFLGGDDADQGYGIAIDAAGNAHVAGYTGQSSTFPTTTGAFRRQVPSFACSREYGTWKYFCEDAFVTKINPTGTGLVYSTLLGGGADERGRAVAVDGAGNAYVTGTTNTPSGSPALAFPTTSGAVQPALGGFIDAFVTELNSTGTALVYSSYLGGSGTEEGRGIAVDPSGNAYVVGNTTSSDFPTVNAVQSSYGGPTTSSFVGDAFLAKFSGFPTVPTAVNDSYATSTNTALTVPAPGVLGNDTTNGGGAMTASVVSAPSSGTLTLNVDGGFTYTPASGFAGAAMFTYRADNNVGSGTTATVTLTVTTPTVLRPPTNLRVTSIVGNTVAIAFTAPLDSIAPSGYVLEGGISPGQVIAGLPTGSAATTFSFTAPDGAFYIRVHSVSGAQKSAASNESRIFVNVPSPPSAPANLLALVNGSSLTLAWMNTAAGGAPTRLLVDVSGSLTTTVSMPAGETASFPFVPAGSYTLALRAENGAGTSAPSNGVTVAIPGACGGPPGTPTNFTVTKSGNVISASWHLPAAGPAPNSYALMVTGAFAGSFPVTARSISGAVGPGSYTLTVASTNACGTSAATAAQSVTIP